jgi:hypothetical protein
VRLLVLTTASMKMTAFWDSMPCILAEIDRRFRSLMMEAVSSSETSVNFYEPIYGATPQKTFILVQEADERFGHHCNVIRAGSTVKLIFLSMPTNPLHSPACGIISIRPPPSHHPFKCHSQWNVFQHRNGIEKLQEFPSCLFFQSVD